MDYKEMMGQWVEEHKYEREDGKWQKLSCRVGEPIGRETYKTEEELDEALWDEVVTLSIADL